jgi:hypothetical protein
MGSDPRGRCRRPRSLRKPLCGSRWVALVGGGTITRRRSVLRSRPTARPTAPSFDLIARTRKCAWTPDLHAARRPRRPSTRTGARSPRSARRLPFAAVFTEDVPREFEGESSSAARPPRPSRVGLPNASRCEWMGRARLLGVPPERALCPRVVGGRHPAGFRGHGSTEVPHIGEAVTSVAASFPCAGRTARAARAAHSRRCPPAGNGTVNLAKPGRRRVHGPCGLRGDLGEARRRSTAPGARGSTAARSTPRGTRMTRDSGRRGPRARALRIRAGVHPAAGRAGQPWRTSQASRPSRERCASWKTSPKP